MPYGSYGGYAGVSQSENVELTDRDKEIIQRLKDWDLWGPLIVCLALAVLLSFKAPEGTFYFRCWGEGDVASIYVSSVPVE